MQVPKQCCVQLYPKVVFSKNNQGKATPGSVFQGSLLDNFGNHVGYGELNQSDTYKANVLSTMTLVLNFHKLFLKGSLLNGMPPPI